MAEDIRILSLRLLDRLDKHISAQLLLLCNRDAHSGMWYDGAEGPVGFTGLHGVALLGMKGIAAAVLGMKE